MMNAEEITVALRTLSNEIHEAAVNEYSFIEQIMYLAQAAEEILAPCRLPEHILRNSELSHPDKSVFYVISHFCAGHSGCNITQKRLASYVGCYPSTISASIRRLKDLGFLKAEKITHQYGDDLCYFPVFPDSELDFEDVRILTEEDFDA